MAAMNEIHIMRPDPMVAFEGRTHPITGRPGELFRLLVLHNGKTVRKGTIANLRDTAAATAASKVRYLKDQLGVVGCSDLIATDRPHGYRAAVDVGEWFVDAREFRSS